MSERERQERVKEIERKISDLRSEYVGTLADNMLRSLEAERDRLVQSNWGEDEPIPEDIYASEGNFYSSASRLGMGWGFYKKWCSRISEFPTAPAPFTPAEPNPPGSGPVAWDYRYRYRETGAWSRWRRADTPEQAEYNGQAQTRESADIYEVRALYAAPLFSPSEGAGKQIKELERQNGWLDARLHDREADLAVERQRREEAEALALPLSEAWAAHGSTERNKLDALRGCLGTWHFSDAAKHFAKYGTRATATGGGDNG